MDPTRASEEGGSSNVSDPPKKKRRRVGTACKSCRIKRTKCDALRPCSTCQLSGEQCLYDSTGVSTSAAGASRQLLEMQLRLQLLENRLVEDDGAPQGREIPLGSTSTSPAQQHAPRRRPLTLTGDSGAFFSNLILNAMRVGGVPPPDRPLDRVPLDEADLLLWSVPAELDELLSHYFRLLHFIWNVGHEPTMRTTFRRISQMSAAERTTERCSLAFLNMVACNATVHAVPAVPNARSRARELYDRGMALLAPVMLVDWSLVKAQALFLGAAYLQTSGMPDECWNVFGIAVRLSFGLDLHRPPPPEMDNVEKETRKRLWFCCFVFDQQLSMIYGRPSMIRSSETTTPLPEDLSDDCIAADRLLYPSPRRSHSGTVFIKTCELSRILESVLLAQQAAGSPRAVIQAAGVLDDSLEDWRSTIPPELAVDASGYSANPLALVLALRACMVGIQIHRPALTLWLDQLPTYAASAAAGSVDRAAPDRESSATRLARFSRRQCVDTAIYVVKVVANRDGQQEGSSGPSWHNLYYTFTSILVIVSHVVDPENSDDLSPAFSALKQAMGMVRRLAVNHECAARAHEFVKQLVDTMERTFGLRALASRASSPAPPPPVQLSEAHAAPPTEGLDADLFGGLNDPQSLDLMSLFSVTQDLNDYLASSLLSFPVNDLPVLDSQQLQQWDAGQF